MLEKIKNVGQYGIIRDMEPHELPNNAWSDAQSIRVRENSVEKFQGEAAAYDPPSIAPYTIFPMRNGGSYFWCYAGAEAVYATDGTDHADISNGSYNTDSNVRWSGDSYGNILLLTNGVEVPQMWAPAELSTALVDLTGWDANWTAKCIRTFKSYILALDLTKSGTRYGTMCKWSDSGSADTVPTSWDETDPTTDAGESNGVLSESSDLLVDCLTLGDINVLYKEGSTYGMQFIGGNNIFRFWRMFEQSGILTRWCMTAFEKKHFVATQDDIVVHDGVTIQSIADARVQRTIRALIDADNYQACHVAPNYQNTEIWFCYPSAGETWCDKAWVWDWRNNTWYQRDLPGVSHTAFGRIGEALTDSWSSDTDTWDSDVSRWDEADVDPTARGLIMAGFPDTKLWRADQGYQFNGSNFTSYVERKGLTLDTTQFLKRPTRILPFIEGTNGETITIKVGGHNDPDDTPTYDLSATYTIGTDNWIDCEEVGSWRYLSVYFGDSGSQKWRMSRYDIDYFYDGER